MLCFLMASSSWCAHFAAISSNFSLSYFWMLNSSLSSSSVVNSALSFFFVSVNGVWRLPSRCFRIRGTN